jgi:ribonuclease PH
MRNFWCDMQFRAALARATAVTAATVAVAQAGSPVEQPILREIAVAL